MRMPAFRVALTGGAVTILAVGAIGLAAAAGAPSTKVPTDAATVTSDTVTTDEDLAIELAADVEATDRLGAGDGAKLKRLLRLGRHLVHAEVTVTDKDGNLVNLQLDHGTIQSISGGSIVIAETGGGTETVSTSDATKVHLGRKAGGVADLTVGAEIFVQSRLDGGTTLAKRIIVIPAGS